MRCGPRRGRRLGHALQQLAAAPVSARRRPALPARCQRVVDQLALVAALRHPSRPCARPSATRLRRSARPRRCPRSAAAAAAAAGLVELADEAREHLRGAARAVVAREIRRGCRSSARRGRRTPGSRSVPPAWCAAITSASPRPSTLMSWRDWTWVSARMRSRNKAAVSNSSAALACSSASASAAAPALWPARNVVASLDELAVARLVDAPDAGPRSA